MKALASKTQEIFASFSKTCSDPDQAELFEKLGKAWADLN